MRIQASVSKWFPVPDDPDEGEVEIKHLKKGEISDIVAKCYATRTVHKKDDSQETVSEVIRRPDIAIVEASITGWRNFKNEKGKALKCTKQNIARFCAEDGFPEFIDSCREKLAAEANKKARAAEKN